MHSLVGLTTSLAEMVVAMRVDFDNERLARVEDTLNTMHEPYDHWERWRLSELKRAISSFMLNPNHPARR